MSPRIKAGPLGQFWRGRSQAGRLPPRQRVEMRARARARAALRPSPPCPLTLNATQRGMSPTSGAGSSIVEFSRWISNWAPPWL